MVISVLLEILWWIALAVFVVIAALGAFLSLALMSVLTIARGIVGMRRRARRTAVAPAV